MSRPAQLLVSGDVVELSSGDVVPADCRVLQAVGLLVDESALTGEPFPVIKTADAVEAATPPPPPPGVEARLSALTHATIPIALGSAGAVIAAGLLRGQPLRHSLGAAVSLAVAAVPEGLPFLVSAAQLASARRLSQQDTLVRNPRTIETLGRVDTLCYDKTGTLTQGRITLASVADPTGEPSPIEQLTGVQRRTLAAALRATSRNRRGEPLEHLTDRAIAEGAQAAGVTRRDAASTPRSARPVTNKGVVPTRGCARCWAMRSSVTIWWPFLVWTTVPPREE